MNSCKNCNEPIIGNYCSNCGRPAKLKRIDGHYIIREIADVFNADRGFFYTVKRMLINPGDSVRYYITEDRSRYVKPVTFVILTSLIYTLVNHFFPIGIEDWVKQVDEMDIAILIVEWTQKNSGYTTLFIGFFMAFGVKLFFRKAGYNLFEIFILLCYVFGMTSLFESVAAIIQAVTRVNLLTALFIFDPIYIAWAVGQFFDRKKATSYIKALLSYAFGFCMLTLIMAFVVVIYMIIKQ